MSTSSVSRWNAIPMSREQYTPSLKRSRQDEEDDDDDDVSIVSRTPSPPPVDAMDVDVEHLSKYDEYVRGTPREVITVETKLKPSNKGFAMLAKLGWAEGQPLGISGDGRVEPIPFQIKRDLTGLGKTNQDVRMIETTVSQRRGLDSERQQKETEEQRQAREDSVARRSALQSEISDTLKAFYCTLCDKQFKNVAQYDEHTNSYAHHHKARFKDMQANIRIKPKEEVDKRKEKERKREEKELRKIAAAAGIKMAKPSTLPVASTSVPETNIDAQQSTDPRNLGWATSSEAPAVQPGFRKSGWATVGSSNIPPPEPPQTTGGWASSSVAASTLQTPVNHATRAPSAAPAFRTAGWTSLDTGSSQPIPSHAPPPPPQSIPLPPSPPPENPRPRSSWSSIPPGPTHTHTPTPQSTGGWGPVSSSSSTLPIPQPQAPTPVARTGWQQFQKSGPKRR